MKTEKRNVTIVNLDKDEVNKMLQAPDGVRVAHGGQQGRFVVVAHDKTRDDVDAVLRASVPDLPPVGEYMFRLQADGSAIVRWQNK